MSSSHVISEIKGPAGLLTLNRARALNALSLAMVRDLTTALLVWRDDPAVQVVAIRGTGKNPTTGQEEPFGAFCAGGDIRFFHQAALAGNPELEDFFTEEYRLNHLVHSYPKPVVALMDGIVMGGGMGIAQGAGMRIVTERTRMAMPETNIGLFPDVGGGYFLSRCPGHLGEYLALTGQMLNGQQAIATGLADHWMPSSGLPSLWDNLANQGLAALDALRTTPRATAASEPVRADPFGVAQDRPVEAPALPLDQINHYFARPSLLEIVHALETAAATDTWARDTAATLRKRSPLMLSVTLEQVRRAQSMGIADDLRMERELVRHCFHPAHLARSGAGTEVVEGIRALAVDKDHQPRWNPPRIEDITPDMVAPFFHSPWPAHAHPLRGLA